MEDLDKFKKEKFSFGANPVDYYNNNFRVTDFSGLSQAIQVDEDTKNILDTTGQMVLEWKHEVSMYVAYPQAQALNVCYAGEYTPFQLLVGWRFKGNYRQAMAFVDFKYLNHEVPYIRVGVDYYKLVHKKDSYGIDSKELKVWKKDTIKDDHGKDVLSRVPIFDDFDVVPSNTNHQRVVNGCWNLYQPFPHKVSTKKVGLEDIPVTHRFMTHIFGDQLDLGYKYMKVLYEKPTQILPVLALVSRENQTGKTTFSNWIQMLLGSNYVMIRARDLFSDFNASYAYKNVIAIDEGVVEKRHGVEIIKSLATAPSIMVNQKNVSHYSIPFYGKLIITTNAEYNFMHIEDEEIRFWVRKLYPLNKVEPDIQKKLLKEIPKFIKYLTQLEDVDYSKSRMVFTAEELRNKHLETVKKESRSWIRKEIESGIQDLFESEVYDDEIRMSPVDIRNVLFDSRNAPGKTEIARVLRNEMRMEPDDLQRYQPPRSESKPGRPYVFPRHLHTPTPAAEIPRAVEVFDE